LGRKSRIIGAHRSPVKSFERLRGIFQPLPASLRPALPFLGLAAVLVTAWLWLRHGLQRLAGLVREPSSASSRRVLSSGEQARRYFPGMEQAPLNQVLVAVARAFCLRSDQLRPWDRIAPAHSNVRRELAALGIRLDLDALPLVGSLVHAAVPLRETDPRIHH
jgi:hypothetical protein